VTDYKETKTVVYAYLSELFRIQQEVKEDVNAFCSESFWDKAAIYVFRGHNDADYEKPYFDHNNFVASTSLRFSIAANFAKPLHTSAYKRNMPGDTGTDKSTVYIYKMSGASNVLFTQPFTKHVEYEMTLFPDDQSAFLESLTRYMDFSLEEIFDRVHANPQPRLHVPPIETVEEINSNNVNVYHNNLIILDSDLAKVSDRNLHKAGKQWMLYDFFANVPLVACLLTFYLQKWS